MIINEETIKNIRGEFKNRFNALIFKIGGPENLSDEEVQLLIDRGYIEPNDPSNGLIAHAYHISRVRSGMAFHERPKIDLRQFREQVHRIMPPLTARENYAIEHTKRSAGNYLVSLRDKALANVEGEIRGYNYDERNRMLNEVVRPTIEAGFREVRTTVDEVARRLREKTGDLYRDWRRVAITEVSNALNLGAADAIVARNSDKHTDDIYVYKIVSNDANLCPYCKKFYLDANGVTPKVYKMTELMGNGSNMGKKASEWKPTIGATHPHERCELVELPQGWGFRPGSSQATFMGKDYLWARDKDL